MLIDFLTAPDRFGKFGFSVFIVGHDVDCFDDNISDFASEALGVSSFQL